MNQVGHLVYGDDSGYNERVILEEGQVQLILCLNGTEFSLYRLSAPGTSLDNMAYYTSRLAVHNYQLALALLAARAQEESHV